MPVPSKVGALLDQFDLSELPGELDKGDRCQGAKFHSPAPLLVNEVPLVSPLLGEATEDVVWLCPTCATNLYVYQFLMVATEGKMEWAVKREFGNLIRALGNKAWEQTQSVNNG